jgi:hypothetical protein
MSLSMNRLRGKLARLKAGDEPPKGALSADGECAVRQSSQMVPVQTIGDRGPLNSRINGGVGPVDGQFLAMVGVGQQREILL